jgi:Secretion system C-terminal sorting domain
MIHIETLSNSCPYLAGNAVYKARALYAMLVPGMFFDNLDICNAAGVYRTSDSTDYIKEQAMLDADLTIKAIITNNEVKIYPNPTHNQLFVNHGFNLNSGAEIKIINVLGSTILSQAVIVNKTLTRIELGNVAPGVYACQYLNNGKVVFVGKFVVK